MELVPTCSPSQSHSPSIRSRARADTMRARCMIACLVFVLTTAPQACLGHGHGVEQQTHGRGWRVRQLPVLDDPERAHTAMLEADYEQLESHWELEPDSYEYPDPEASALEEGMFTADLESDDSMPTDAPQQHLLDQEQDLQLDDSEEQADNKAPDASAAAVPTGRGGLRAAITSRMHARLGSLRPPPAHWASVMQLVDKHHHQLVDLMVQSHFHAAAAGQPAAGHRETIALLSAAALPRRPCPRHQAQVVARLLEQQRQQLAAKLGHIQLNHPAAAVQAVSAGTHQHHIRRMGQHSIHMFSMGPILFQSPFDDSVLVAEAETTTTTAPVKEWHTLVHIHTARVRLLLIWAIAGCSALLLGMQLMQLVRYWRRQQRRKQLAHAAQPLLAWLSDEEAAAAAKKLPQPQIVVAAADSKH